MVKMRKLKGSCIYQRVANTNKYLQLPDVLGDQPLPDQAIKQRMVTHLCDLLLHMSVTTPFPIPYRDHMKMLASIGMEQQVCHLRERVYLLKGLILLMFFWMLPAEARCREWLEPSGKPRAVAIVAHGLNLRPERMGEVSRLLQKAGVAVMQVGLAGHCGGDEFFSVTAEAFRADARAFHTEASRRAQKLKVPLVLVAYSFSALVFLDLPFERAALFAPAFATRWWYPAAIWLARRLPASIWLSSVVPDGYRANDRTGPAPMLALDDLMRGFSEESISPATLVFVDLQDELVDGPGVKALARSRGARVEEISVEGRHHHLIIDAASVGEKNWAKVSSTLAPFLLGE